MNVIAAFSGCLNDAVYYLAEKPIELKTNKVNVIHVDDEPVHLNQFRQIASEIEDCAYVRGFTDAATCLQWLKKSGEHFLIFSDVEMPGEDGLWLAQQLSETNHSMIFLTNYPAYAVQAFETTALHYVLKPITAAKVRQAIALIREKKSRIDAMMIEQVKELQYLHGRSQPPKRLFINSTDDIKVINTDEIVHITSSGSYTYFKLQSGQTVLSSKRIKSYEDLLENHPDFLRIHKSNIINKRYLSSISKKQRDYRAIMTNHDELEMSYQRKDELILQMHV